MKPAILLLATVLLCTAASCSELSADPGVVRVQAPAGKCWSGAIGDSTKEGCGTKAFRIEGESVIVANAQKQTPGRWRLRMTLTVGGDVKDVSVTDASYGIAQVSE